MQQIGNSLHRKHTGILFDYFDEYKFAKLNINTYVKKGCSDLPADTLPILCYNKK